MSIGMFNNLYLYCNKCYGSNADMVTFTTTTTDNNIITFSSMAKKTITKLRRLFKAIGINYDEWEKYCSEWR
jgi:hypothetical protein